MNKKQEENWHKLSEEHVQEVRKKITPTDIENAWKAVTDKFPFPTKEEAEKMATLRVNQTEDTLSFTVNGDKMKYTTGTLGFYNTIKACEEYFPKESRWPIVIFNGKVLTDDERKSFWEQTTKLLSRYDN